MLQLKKKSPLRRTEIEPRYQQASTEIPMQMKSYFEAASGYSLDDVQIHYNSEKPARVGAAAYTSGSQVYVGPGKEQSLPHELGHVIQQKQGRVKPDSEVNGLPLNRSVVLEGEADRAAEAYLLGNVSGSGETLQRKRTSQEVLQLKDWATPDVRRRLGNFSGHHIISRNDLTNLIEWAKKDKAPASKTFLNLYSDNNNKKRLVNLPANIVMGPRKYSNNPDERWDPNTVRAPLEAADFEYMGFTREQAQRFKIEKRVESPQAQALRPLQEKINSRVGEWSEWSNEEWEEILRILQPLERMTVDDIEYNPDEWILENGEDNPAEARNTYCRKRPGYVLTSSIPDLFAMAANLEEEREMPGDMEFVIEMEENVRAEVTIGLPHILKRHSLRHWDGKVTNVNMFFPLRMNGAAIAEWCKEQVPGIITRRMKRISKELGPSGYCQQTIQGVEEGIFAIGTISAFSSGEGAGLDIVLDLKTLCMNDNSIQIPSSALTSAK